MVSFLTSAPKTTARHPVRTPFAHLFAQHDVADHLEDVLERHGRVVVIEDGGESLEVVRASGVPGSGSEIQGEPLEN